ncbi:MAG: hypothetical protein J6T84_01270 [Spirochaetaceae bacterium]|nr:hypothetical protein [Spirochaetaceae bacterium]
MIFLSLSVLVFGFCFFCVGFGVQKIFKFSIRNNIALLCLLGISFSSLFFNIAQFFMPLGIITLSLIFAFGGVGCYLFIKSRYYTNYTYTISGILGLLLCFFILLVYFSSGKSIPLSAGYDTLLYHSSLVSWLNYSKIIPGLANLHGRLGMNSFYLILAAGIDVGIFDKYSSVILPFLFYFLSLLYFFENIKNTDSKQLHFVSVILIFWLIFCNKANPNLYYDIPSMIFTAVIFYEFLLKEFQCNDYEKKLTSDEVLFIYASMSFCIKQIGVINLVVIFFYGIRNLINKKSFSFLSCLKFISIPILFGASYIARNIIQTGFPLYPLPLFSLNLAWTNLKTAVNTYNDIIGCARLPGPEYLKSLDNGFLFWFVPWINSNIKSYNCIYYFLLLLSSILCVINITNKKKLINIRKIVLFNSIILLNIGFWFYSAPDFRFGSVFFFIFFAFNIYFLNINIKFITKEIIFVSFVFFFCETHQRDLVQLFFPAKVQSLPCHPVELDNGHNPPLTVYVPDKGDQTGDATLPCTPYPNDKLKLLKPGNIKSGFYIDE